jgi:hypothetical protein
LLASRDIIEFQRAMSSSRLDLTNMKYNAYIHSRNEKMEDMLGSRQNLIHVLRRNEV